MRWVIAVVVWIATAAVLAPVCFYAVLILAGPHSSMLPSTIQPAVLIAGWLVVLVTPILLARAAWLVRAADSIRMVTAIRTDGSGERIRDAVYAAQRPSAE